MTKSKGKYKVGDTITVKPLREIMYQIDSNNGIADLSWMPEMDYMAGGTFVVQGLSRQGNYVVNNSDYKLADGWLVNA